MGEHAAPTLHPLGDAALVLVFGERIDPAINARVLAAWRAIRALRLPGVRDVVPAYASITVHIDPGIPSVDALSARLLDVCSTLPPGMDATRLVEVPVCYDAAFAPDMDALCAHAGLAREEVIERHSRPDYRVYFIGFTPGFPYLGGLDPALAMPRRETPRTRVEAGSVAIGGTQTGIYPTRSPGGWRIIGRTPLGLFEHGRDPCCLLAPGDTVRFVPVSADEFAALSQGG
jgi:KipI family sensor histidine kinase inhibitor